MLAVTVPPLVSGPPLTMVPTDAVKMPPTGVTASVGRSVAERPS